MAASEREDRGLSAGSVLLAFLAGATAGAVAALLLAPQSGRDSRDQLRLYARRTEEGIRDLAERAGELWDDAIGKSKEFMEEKKTVLTEALDAGREAMRRERDRRTSDTKS
jgi:gas vesicle protein